MRLDGWFDLAAETADRAAAHAAAGDIRGATQEIRQFMKMPGPEPDGQLPAGWVYGLTDIQHALVTAEVLLEGLEVLEERAIVDPVPLGRTVHAIRATAIALTALLVDAVETRTVPDVDAFRESFDGWWNYPFREHIIRTER